MATVAKQLQQRYDKDAGLLRDQKTFIVQLGPRDDAAEDTAKLWASRNSVKLPIVLLAEGDKSPAYRLYRLDRDYAYTIMVAQENIIRFNMAVPKTAQLDDAAVGKLVKAADAVVARLRK